jgi:hypothetical protein
MLVKFVYVDKAHKGILARNKGRSIIYGGKCLQAICVSDEQASRSAVYLYEGNGNKLKLEVEKKKPVLGFSCNCTAADFEKNLSSPGRFRYPKHVHQTRNRGFTAPFQQSVAW